MSRDLGVSHWSLSRWLKDAQSGQVLSEPRTLSSERPEQRELRRLRQENDYLRRRRDILQKACSHLVGRGAAQRFTVMEQMKASHCFTEMADALEISKSRDVWCGYRASGGELLLVSNKTGEELSAELLALIYRSRWRVELFFKWLKCILGCHHWLAESERGVALQVYCALIAALLLLRSSGRRPGKRAMEMIRFYLLGYATLDELSAALKLAQKST